MHLRGDSQAERLKYSGDVQKTRGDSSPQRIQGLPGFRFKFAYLDRSTDRAERFRKCVFVVFFHHDVQIIRNGLSVVQVLSHLKDGQIGDFDFFGHGLVLQNSGPLDCGGNVSSLGGFVSAAQHHNQHRATLDGVHAQIVAIPHRLDHLTPTNSGRRLKIPIAHAVPALLGGIFVYALSMGGCWVAARPQRSCAVGAPSRPLGGIFPKHMRLS